MLLGIVPYQQLNVADPLAVGIDATGLTWLSPVIKVAALFGLFSTMLVQLLGADADLLLDEPRRPAAARLRAWCIRGSARRTSAPSLTGVIIALMAGLTPIAVLGQLVSIGTLLAFVLVSIGVIILRKTAPDAAAAVPHAVGAVRADRSAR